MVVLLPSLLATTVGLGSSPARFPIFPRLTSKRVIYVLDMAVGCSFFWGKFHQQRTSIEFHYPYGVWIGSNYLMESFRKTQLPHGKCQLAFIMWSNEFILTMSTKWSNEFIIDCQINMNSHRSQYHRFIYFIARTVSSNNWRSPKTSVYKISYH